MNTRLSTRTTILIIADLAIIYGGILIGLYLRLGVEGAAEQLVDNNGWAKTALVTVVCLISIYIFDLYDYAVVNSRRELVLRLVQALGISWAILAILFYFVPSLLVGRGAAFFSIFVTLVLLLSFRLSIHYFLGHPDLGEKILIIGDRQVIIDTAQATASRRDAGHRIVGYLANDPEAAIVSAPLLRDLGRIEDLEEVVEKEKIDRIVLGVRERRGTFPAESLLKLRLAGNVSIEESTSFFERVTGKVHLDNLRPSWLIFSFRPRDTRLSTFVRESLYRGIALVGLLISLPIALVTALLIKLETEGPFLYKQERVGKNGVSFTLYKFRSMHQDAEANGEPVWATDDDERATKVGKIIRKIRVDEIPQFWNIIKGEMSFIGPRPERPHFVSHLAADIPFYEYRHLVAPGLTGWAQINYPYGASIEDARQKLQYDLYYIKNQSFALDVIIMFETVKTVIFGRGAR